MSFNIQEKYRETLDLLKEGKRPLIKLSDEEAEVLSQKWSELNESQAHEDEYLPLLCIADHLTHSHPSLVDPLLYGLKNRKEPNLLVYLLTASMKVIVLDCEQRGNRFPFPFLEALKEPLKHDNWEVIQWTLRVVDQLGDQSIYLKPDVLAKRPGLLSRVNPHARVVLELIDYLEKRWNPPKVK